MQQNNYRVCLVLAHAVANADLCHATHLLQTVAKGFSFGGHGGAWERKKLSSLNHFKCSIKKSISRGKIGHAYHLF